MLTNIEILIYKIPGYLKQSWFYQVYICSISKGIKYSKREIFPLFIAFIANS